jgi:hypothetical protein
MYFSASMAFPILRWSRRWSGETRGIHERPMLPEFDFRKFSRNHKMASSVGEMFRRARVHETEITESLIAAARRASAHAPR